MPKRKMYGEGSQFDEISEYIFVLQGEKYCMPSVLRGSDKGIQLIFAF